MMMMMMMMFILAPNITALDRGFQVTQVSLGNIITITLAFPVTVVANAMDGLLL